MIYSKNWKTTHMAGSCVYHPRIQHLKYESSYGLQSARIPDIWNTHFPWSLHGILEDAIFCRLQDFLVLYESVNNALFICFEDFGTTFNTFYKFDAFDAALPLPALTREVTSPLFKILSFCSLVLASLPRGNLLRPSLSIFPPLPERQFFLVSRHHSYLHHHRLFRHHLLLTHHCVLVLATYAAHKSHLCHLFNSCPHHGFSLHLLRPYHPHLCPSHPHTLYPSLFHCQNSSIILTDFSA